MATDTSQPNRMLQSGGCTLNRVRFWRCCLILPFLVLQALPAWALDPERRISQYGHAAWRLSDGFFSGGPVTVTQTRDGYLWVGTLSGLVRFDGVRFVPWRPEHGPRLPSSEVLDLMAASDGSLWIATLGGLSRWKNQTLINYPSGPGGTVSVLEDPKGRIWFGQNIAAGGTGPLCEVLGGSETRCYGTSDGVPRLRRAHPELEDRGGNLWFASDETLVRWTPHSHSVYELSGTTRPSGIYGLAEAPDGTLWVGTERAGPGLGLQRLVDGKWKPFKTREFDGSTLAVETLYADREGALWVGTLDHGIYRIQGDRVDHFGTADGLSSDLVLAFTEDREGNLWVATNLGVDRFADTAVVGFSTREGLCSSEAGSISASRDGSVWIGGDRALSRLRNGMVSCIRAGEGLPGTQVTSLFEDHAGRLWVGLDDNLWVYENARFRRITRQDGSAVGLVMGIAEDTENRVWITVSASPRILMRIEGLKVQEEHHELQKPRKVVADPTGGLWLGLLNGDLAHFRDGKVATYRFVHDRAALVNQVLANSDGSVLAATTYGLIGWRNGKTLTLTAKNGLPCDEVFALTFDDGGNLWLFMNCGLAEIKSADLQRWLRNPESGVLTKTLDMLDGVRTGRSSFDGAARSPDGRLWFVNASSLQMVDPDHLYRNQVRPPVYIEQVVADRKSYPVKGAVRLPALSRDLEIDYAGLSFVAPQKVLFRYRLEGRDKTWQESGTRRQAFYTDLPPGSYHFRVIACNNGGLWNEEGAALDFVIASAFYQTGWFKTLCAVVFLSALWGLYRYRLYQVARDFNVRLKERVAERTRMARDLHDTLLQSFQGSLLEFQAARNLFSNRPEDAMRSLDGAIGSAEAAIVEGRNAIQDLRTGSEVRSELAHLLTAAGQELSEAQALDGDRPAFDLTVEGPAQTLPPVLQDEVYRMGREIVRNAFLHAHARRIEVEIRYEDRMLRLRIRDDGIGIDPNVLAEGGRAGHWGLPGVRERAKLIGAKLDFWSEPGAGTEVQVAVPASVAYKTSGDGRVLGFFRKTTRSIEKTAQNSRGVRRATQRSSEFLYRLVARIRALCTYDD